MRRFADWRNQTLQPTLERLIRETQQMLSIPDSAGIGDLHVYQ
jgi:hypothetical protein